MKSKTVKRYSKKQILSMLDPLIAEWFTNRFEDFTEPQSYAVPLIHQRKNVLVSSPTGSGKTLTAFTSIINELFKYSKEGKLEDRVYAVYISPLKALANDIDKNLEEPLREMRETAERLGTEFPNIRVGVRTGDTSQSERQKMLRKPPHILITTPESLALILAAPKFREKLSGVEYVILDEIHEVCDSKRGVFLSLTLERLQDICSKPFVRVGLSATLAPINEVAEYLCGYENGAPRDFNIVEIMRQRDLDIQVICPTEDMTALPYEVVNAKMYDRLSEMINEHRTTIVFTNTRSGTENIVYKLRERGLESVEAHHGSLAKETRLDVEERLKNGELKCVVSSTSLELGIDIGFVDLVVQIGSPKSVAKGLQRIGRSGHGHGLTSKGRILVFEKDDLVECAVLCRAAHDKHIDRVSISENCLDVLSQSVVGMSLEKRWEVDEALELVRRSYCFRNLKKETFLEVLRYLGSKDAFEGVYPKIWYDEEENIFGRRSGSRMIYFLNLGTIPEEANYKVFTEKGGMIGDLSEKFVERLSSGDVFVLGGKPYEYVRSKGMKVFVRDAGGRKPTVPSWSGEMLPRSFDLSMGVAKFRREMAERIDRDDNMEWLMSFGVDAGSAQSIISYFNEQKGSCGYIPDDKDLIIEGYVDPSGKYSMVFHFPFGRRVNDALSRAYAFVITREMNCNVSVSVTDDTFMISSPERINLAVVKDLLKESALEDTLMRAIKDSELFKQRFRHTASRSFMILRNYKGKEVSVGRQQIRSSYLLDALRSIDGVPVIDETYREIMEDVMDINNAKLILHNIESGEMKVHTIDYNSSPSPFAHNAVLAGISDMVLMEDRGALLRELHRKVLTKVLGVDISEFEFKEDQVVPYFRQKTGTASTKQELFSLISRIQPVRVFKEKGRNVYPFCLANREDIDEWTRELLEDGKISTIFLDDVYFVTSKDLPVYLSALSSQRTLNELDNKVLESLDEEHMIPELVSSLEVPREKIAQSLRKLEVCGLVKRTAYQNGKWTYLKQEELSLPSREESIDTAILNYLNCYAPADVEDIAFALSLSSKEVQTALKGMMHRELVREGKYLVSENNQYMLKKDYLRLKTDNLQAYDYSNVEAHRRNKQDGPFDTIEELFKANVTLGSPLDAFYRVNNFSMKDWEELRKSGKILLGRFMRGRVRYILSEDAPPYVSAYRRDKLNALDTRVLEIISSAMGDGASLRQISAIMPDRSKDEIKESIDHLDRNMYVVRRFEEREERASENTYIRYDAPEFDGDPVRDIVEQYIRSYGPISVYMISTATQFTNEQIMNVIKDLDVESVSVGEGREEMFVFRDELENLGKASTQPQGCKVVSLYDPSVQSIWAAVASRFGDRWIYPIIRDGTLIGGAEKWNMSGVIEIRELDVDTVENIPSVLDALDVLMQYHKMEGYDVIRMREVMGNTPSNSPQEVRDIFSSKGWIEVGDMFAKGNLVPTRCSFDSALSLVFTKQGLGKRFQNVADAIKVQGGLRSDASTSIRCRNRIPLKSLFDMGFVVKVQAIPDYITYTSLEFASLCRAAKNREITPDMKLILKMIESGKPMFKGTILNNSPLSKDATQEALKSLTSGAIIYTDQNKRFRIIPDSGMDVHDARKSIIIHFFENYGLFSAENLSRFLRFRMPMRDIRQILAELEDEDFLVKGFLVDGTDTMYWIMKSELESYGAANFKGEVVITPDDNLHTYLSDWIKKLRGGATYSVIMDGSRLAGSFRGRVNSKDEMSVEDFLGSREAELILERYARSNGIVCKRTTDSEDDWDILSFYEKTNPGTV